MFTSRLLFDQFVQNLTFFSKVFLLFSPILTLIKINTLNLIYVPQQRISFQIEKFGTKKCYTLYYAIGFIVYIYIYIMFVDFFNYLMQKDE